MNLDKHPIFWDIYNVVQAIEVCGASPELTNAVIKAGALSEPAEKLVDRIAELERAQGNAVMVPGPELLKMRDRIAALEKALELSVKAFDKAKKYFEEQHDLDNQKAEVLGFGGDSNTRQVMYGANVWINVTNYMEMLGGMMKEPREALKKVKGD